MVMAAGRTYSAGLPKQNENKKVINFGSHQKNFLDNLKQVDTIILNICRVFGTFYCICPTNTQYIY